MNFQLRNEFSFSVFTITHEIHEHPLTCQDKNIGNRFFIYRIPSKWSKLCTKSPWYAVWSRQTRKTCARKSITTWNRFWFFTADRGENDFAWDSKGAKKRDRRALACTDIFTSNRTLTSAAYRANLTRACGENFTTSHIKPTRKQRDRLPNSFNKCKCCAVQLHTTNSMALSYAVKIRAL